MLPYLFFFQFPVTNDGKASRYRIMHLSKGSRVTVYHHAMDHMEKVLLTELGDLTFLGNSQTQAEAKNLARAGPNSTMTIDGVRNLRLHPNSFEGWQREGSVVWIKNVENCSIDQSAFAPRTRIKRLLLENITSLALAEGAFQGTVGELLLRNVTFRAGCLPDTFGGRVDRLLLVSVTVNRVMPGCVRLQSRARALTLRRSHLGRISTAGITGSFADVTTSECEISAVDSSGVRLTDVSRFSLSDTSVGDLHSDALNVDADQVISLRRLHVSRLHSNAFRGLRVVGGGSRGIDVTELTVARADVGSLTFADGADVRLRMLTFTTRKECDEGREVITNFVHVESAWQPSSEIANVSSRLHAFFEPLFACDLVAALDNRYPDLQKPNATSEERVAM